MKSFILPFLFLLSFAVQAQVDTSSTVFGCTDPSTTNYNPSANSEDRSCQYEDTTSVVFGCTDPSSINFDPSANTSDGSCEYEDTTSVVFGCTDPSAINFDPNANTSDGSCEYEDTTSVVFGCTDPSATNYNPSANSEDGSCQYDDTTSVVFGCTDPSAINFDPSANTSDGSCEYEDTTSVVFGCTDPSAINFDPNANTSDGSCEYEDTTSVVFGCTNPLAYNFNPAANTSDGSCAYVTLQTPSVSPEELTNLVDTLGSQPVSECGLDYNAEVTSANIVNLTYSNDTVFTTWEIIQGSTTVTVFSSYKVKANGDILFTVTLECNQSSQALRTTVTNNVMTLAAVAKANVVTNINNLFEEDNSISCYPNPADQLINITVNGLSGKLQILTLNGSIVSEQAISSGENEISIDGLASGVYIFRIENESGVYLEKVIKE